MKKKYPKHLSIIFVILLSIMSIFIITACFIQTNSIKIKIDTPKDFSSGWYNTRTYNPLDSSQINISKGETLQISHSISKYDLNEIYLGIRSKSLDLTVSLDDEIIFETNPHSELKYGLEVGRVWNQIPLKSGNLLVLTITSNNQSENFELSSLCLGSQSSIFFKILKDNTANIIESTIVLLVTVTLFVYSCFLFLYHIVSYRKTILLLGFFSLSCAIWCVTDGELLQFLFANASLRYLLSYFSFLSIPIFLALFFREILNTGKTFLTRLTFIYTIWLIIILLLYRFNIIHISRTMIITHIYMVLLIIGIAILCIRELTFKKNKQIKGPLVGLTLLIIGSFLNLLQYYTGESSDNSKLFRQSLLLFLFVLFVTTIRDSFQQFNNIRSIERLKQLAYVDPITNGNTKQSFDESLCTLQQKNRYDFWLVYTNLLQYKIINEFLGWEKGNELLKTVYSEAEKCLHAGEFMCRTGSASFIFMISKKENSENLPKRCKEINAAILRCIMNISSNFTLQTEFYVCEMENLPLDQLIDHALMARNNPHAKIWIDEHCYLYTESCRQNILYEKHLENELEAALHEHEFEMYLQPKISPKDEQLHGAEALVRWNSKSEGIIPPYKFIPLFERDGMISKIDIYMFECVCQQIVTWISQGIQPPLISVNVSKRAISETGFFERYRKIIKKTNVPPHYIEFEFTESIAYNNPALLISIIDEIHQFGAKCSMDDFGSNYSNLSSLCELDFDTVKMDMCFFNHGFPDNSKNMHIVKGLIQMLKGMGLTIVAEGIETQNQMLELKKLDCDLIQGYYYDKPLRVFEFEEKYFTTDNKANL